MECLRGKIDLLRLPSQGPVLKRFKEIPFNVHCFIWRASLGRIPSAIALAHRGVAVPSTACNYCGDGAENADHILINCPFAVCIRSWVWNWCGGVQCDPSNIIDMLYMAANWGNNSKSRIIFNAICHGLLWNLWKARNDRIFKKRFKSPTLVFDEVVSMVFLWLKCRGNMGTGDWVKWCISPFHCF